MLRALSLKIKHETGGSVTGLDTAGRAGPADTRADVRPRLRKWARAKLLTNYQAPADTTAVSAAQSLCPGPGRSGAASQTHAAERSLGGRAT